MRPSQRPDEAGGSLIRETSVRVVSSPDNDGAIRHCQTDRVRQARREGVREEPASGRFLRQNTSSNLADMGWAATRTRRMRGTSGPVDVAGPEVMVKVCGVAVTKSQGHSWAPNLSIG